MDAETFVPEMAADEMVALTSAHSFFSWSAQDAVRPIPMTKAEGVYFWDAAGKRYFDLNSQLMCVNIGHGNRRVIEAIKAQADELVYAGPSMATRVRAELGRDLATVTPQGLDKFFFTLGGAEANESAIKMARAFTGRHKIITRYRSYHGATAGAITLTGDHRRWANEPGIPGVVRVFDPYAYRNPLFREGDTEEQFARKCLDQIEAVLMHEDPRTVAAFFLETVTGTNCILVPPQGYLQGLRAICDKHGILLIFDEVITGFGRLGTAFAAERYGVIPDMITFAKGITSGTVPMAGVIMRKGIYDTFMRGPEHVIELFHGYTYSAHPLACAAGIATLDVYRDENLFDRAAKLEGKWADAAMSLKGTPGVLDIRTLGLVAAIDLSSRPDAFGKRAYECMEKAFHEFGLMFRITGDTIALSPPLIITEDQIGEIFEKVKKVIQQVH